LGIVSQTKPASFKNSGSYAIGPVSDWRISPPAVTVPLQGDSPPTGGQSPYRVTVPLQGDSPPTGGVTVPLQGDTIINSIKDIKRKSGAARRRSNFVPEDFVLSQKERLWAQSARPDLDIDAEFEAFRDYEFAVPKSDWNKTFRNWVRAARRKGANGKSARPDTVGAPDVESDAPMAPEVAEVARRRHEKSFGVFDDL
jgi:hypothetical protein